MRSRRLARVLSAVLASAAVSPAVAGDRLERHQPPGAAPIELRFLIREESAARVDRLIDAARRAVDLFTEWIGPYPGASLTIVDAAWRDGAAGAAEGGRVVTSLRWMAPERDRGADRALAAAMARAFWPMRSGGETPWFGEGLVLYLGARGALALSEGGHVVTPRFLGGFVPLPLRRHPVSLPVSHARAWTRGVREVFEPFAAPWRLASAEPGGRADRAAAALHTLERVIGWPALQQALAALRERTAGRVPAPADLGAILVEQRGVDLGWFFDAALDPDARFDYGIERVTSDQVAGGRFRTVVTLARVGDAWFGPRQPIRAGAFGESHLLAVDVVFADGSRAREGWDGRAARVELVYESRARAVGAWVDPDRTLQIDADRSNNARVVEPRRHPQGWRLTAQWFVWLQDLMLSCTAVA